MAGRDTPRGPEKGLAIAGRDPSIPMTGGLTLAQLSTMGMPFENILEKIMQEPGNRAQAIRNLGQGQDRAFRDNLRYIFSRNPNYALFRHLGQDDIVQLSHFMGAAVAANLKKYTAQFPTPKKLYVYDYANGVYDMTIVREILEQTDLLKHRYYRDVIRRLIQVHGMTRSLAQNYNGLRLMRVVGVRMEIYLERAVLENNVEGLRFAIVEMGNACDWAMLEQALIPSQNTSPDMFRLLAELADPDIDDSVRDGLRIIAESLHLPAISPQRQEHVSLLREYLYAWAVGVRMFSRPGEYAWSRRRYEEFLREYYQEWGRDDDAAY